MPNIRTYTNPIDGLRPSETGVEAFQRAGHYEGQLYHVAAEEIGRGLTQGLAPVAQTLQMHADTSNRLKSANEGSQLLYSSMTGMNDALQQADPNDTQAGFKYAQNVEQQLSQYVAGAADERDAAFRTRQADLIRGHMMNHAIADYSQREGFAAKNNAINIANTASNLVLRDPSTFDATRDQILHAASALPPTMRESYVKDGMRLVTKSFLTGLARRDPEAATRAYATGHLDQYISGPEADSIIRQQATILKTEERAARTDQEYQRKQSVQGALSKLSASKIGPDGIPHWSAGDIRQIWAIPGIKADEAQAWQNHVERDIEWANKEPDMRVTNQASFQDIQQRIIDGTAGPLDIAKAEPNLSREASNVLYREFDQIKNNPASKQDWQQFDRFSRALVQAMTGVDPANPAASLLGKDPTAYLAANQLTMRLREDFAQGLAVGNHWQDMLIAGKESSLIPVMADGKTIDMRRLKEMSGVTWPGGASGATSGYTVTDPDTGKPVSIGGPPPIAGTPAVARKPGESAADYLKRTGH